jgi:hypothetical protein
MGQLVRQSHIKPGPNIDRSAYCGIAVDWSRLLLFTRRERTHCRALNANNDIFCLAPSSDFHLNIVCRVCLGEFTATVRLIWLSFSWLLVAWQPGGN